MAPLTSKVVVDSAASRALVALAFREGLLAETQHNDRILENLAHRDYPRWLLAQALEQVVLFEQLHMPLSFPKGGVHGALIEAGPFHLFSDGPKSEAAIKEIDPALINGILKARGIHPTPFEDPSIMADVQLALQRLKEWQQKHGEEPPDGFAIVLNQFFSRERTRHPRYIELEEIRKPLESFQPVVDALREYADLVLAAENRAAFAMSPIYDPNFSGLFQPELVKELNVPTVLLRLTSAKLGVLPYGQTLAATLKLARDPATAALRVKIQEWTESLTDDSSANTENIQKDITEALAHLQRAGIGASVSNVTTYIGVPLALASQVSTFASAVGWIATVAGTIGLGAFHATSRKYRWASFGSSNRI